MEGEEGGREGGEGGRRARFTKLREKNLRIFLTWLPLLDWRETDLWMEERELASCDLSRSFSCDSRQAFLLSASSLTRSYSSCLSSISYT